MISAPPHRPTLGEIAEARDRYLLPNSYCWRFDFVSFTAGKPIAGAEIGIAGLCRRLMPSHVARQATGY
ncbi:hypothetical protein X742_09590 [Mesorhizobium sp. LNHC232B00]|nr:hypothetical protein X742_09590 [Mesorhizobium sp. LNHC232B00]